MGGIEMGGQSSYLPTGGFQEYLYHQVGETITAGGITGKVIEKINGNPGHDGLPLYSNTSKIYFKVNEDGIIEQARIYNGRQAIYDIDWGHTHNEFQKGVAHIHEFVQDKKGNWHRNIKDARYLNNEEIKKYGDLLKKANPSIKFR